MSKLRGMPRRAKWSRPPGGCTAPQVWQNRAAAATGPWQDQQATRLSSDSTVMTIAERRRQRRKEPVSDMEGFAAAAAALLVRIAEDEARLELLLHIIHLGAQDEERGLGIDQHGHPMLLDHLVRGL